MANSHFIEVDFWQARKHRQPVSGDVFLSRKVREEGRLVSVLSDGLGSGVKASVLATLTSTMALKFAVAETDLSRGAATIMSVLPVCSERRIAYSTFTLVDVGRSGDVKIVEYDNPPCLILRNQQVLEPEKREIEVPGTSPEEIPRVLHASAFHAEFGDRIVFFSDGVDQSGMGAPQMPLGWTVPSVTRLALKLIDEEPQISARELARRIVRQAVQNDDGAPKDDITCGVIYFRRPRHLLVATGPPFSKESDSLMAGRVRDFQGRRALCGGTTATIVSRELTLSLEVDLDELDPEIPPTSNMQSIDLITEGTITLAKVAEILENNEVREARRRNGATRLVDILLDSDIIEFLVGTRINEAHQDPNVPVELDIRRNIIKRIRRLLEDKYIKETRLEFI